jgi:hypothetical protein
MSYINYSQYQTTPMISRAYVSTGARVLLCQHAPRPSSILRGREQGSIEVKLALAPTKPRPTVSSVH